MAVTLNKNSFCCIRRLTPFCIKTNLRENRFFLRQGERLVDKKALIMLNFRLKTRQNKIFHIHTHGERHGKHVHLRSPRRAGTGLALKGKTTLTYKFKLINSKKTTHKIKLKNSST